MKNLPKHVKIAGMVWEIKLDRNIAEESHVFGSTHYRSQTIFLEDQIKEQKVKNTLWHEIMHAIIWHTGLCTRIEANNATEEEIVQALTTLQLQVLNENPELTSFLLDNEKE